MFYFNIFVYFITDILTNTLSGSVGIDYTYILSYILITIPSIILLNIILFIEASPDLSWRLIFTTNRSYKKIVNCNVLKFLMFFILILIYSGFFVINQKTTEKLILDYNNEFWTIIMNFGLHNEYWKTNN